VCIFLSSKCDWSAAISHLLFHPCLPQRHLVCSVHFHYIFIWGLCTMKMTGSTVACLRLQVPRLPVLHIYSGRPVTNLQTTNLYHHGCSSAQSSLKASYLSILTVQKTSGFSCLRSSGAKRKPILGGHYLPFLSHIPFLSVARSNRTSTVEFGQYIGLLIATDRS